MDIFVTNDLVEQWETQLPRLLGRERIEALVPLAWHLRQRDTKRSLKLADEVESLLEDCELTPIEIQRIDARITLVRGQAKWLEADLAGAGTMATQALHTFTELEDWRGCSDAHWLLAWLAIDAGKLAQSDIEFQAATDFARQAGDSMRLDVAEAVMARFAVLRNPRLAQERWGKRFDIPSKEQHPALIAWTSEFYGTLAHCTGDFGHALSYTFQVYYSALETGQVRAAIIAATNIAEDFNRLHDHHGALEWMQKALDLAKANQWPRNLGACLMHMAETLRQLKNLDAAQDMLTEAIVVLAPLTESRTYAIAQQYQGDLALDRKDYARALDAFNQLEKKAKELQQLDFFIESQRGKAHALSCLDQPEQALACAQAALDCTREHGDGSREIEVLLIMAEIYSRHPTHAPPQLNVASAPLHCLLQAMEVAKTITGYTVPATLYELLGREYAACGDFAQAYAMARESSATKEKTHGQEATSRAITMQVVHQTESARMEGEYHRQLAAAELERSEDLQRTRKILEQLNAIGREITTHLKADDIFQVLDRYIHSLLDISTFAIYLLEKDGRKLTAAYCTENGKRISVGNVDVSDPVANSARCVREGHEILRDFSEDGHLTHVPGTMRNLTGLYAPLAIGERILGVLSVQSTQHHAFAERELLIFRSMCAYAAIGLDNAHTYQALQDAQQQLVYQGKIAALGSLVAGVAHELNTPVGNGLVLSSGLCDKTEVIAKDFRANQLRRSNLDSYLKDCLLASNLMFESFQTIADLVQSFKQVAVDQATAQRREFGLKQLLQDVVATRQQQMSMSGIACDIDIIDDITMDSYPGPLGQVIINLMNNALMHAFEGRNQGRITVKALRINLDRVQIVFSDDGVGIAHDNLDKIFDPFFTTKMGQGGSGLGLSISYNIVTSILNGNISVNSAIQGGTTFILDLPLVASNIG